MNRQLARSLIRSLIHGQNCNSHVSSYAINSFTETLTVSRHPGYLFFGVSHLRRPLSSGSSPAETALAEKERRENSVADDAGRQMGEQQDNSVIVSSYWGIQRRKITREDGTAWPWNCFMVRGII